MLSKPSIYIKAFTPKSFFPIQLFHADERLMQIVSTKSRSVRETSHQPAFMRSCLLATCVCPVYLVVDELVLVFYGPL